MIGRPPSPITASQVFFEQLVNRSDIGFKVVPLTGGCMALVDDEDYAKVARYRWHLDKKGYAVANFHKEDGTYTTIKMHRIVLDAPRGVLVDHKFNRRLDNRKSELRLCNETQNKRNRAAPRSNKTGHKGVFWRSDRNKYSAYITTDIGRIYLGHFSSYEEAVATYKQAEIKHFGEFACGWEEKAA